MEAAETNTPTTETTTKIITKKNGIKRPDAGSTTGKLWDIADAMSETKGSPALRKDVVDKYMAEVPGANIATANTQYARWVQYHGVSNLLRDARKQETEARRALKDAEAAAEKEKKAAEKAANAEAEAKAKADKEAEKATKAAEAEAEKARKKAEREAAKAAKEAEKLAKKEAAEKAKAEADAAKNNAAA